MKSQTTSLIDRAILVPALRQAFHKLDPRQLFRNPVIFVTEIVATLVTLFFLRDLATDLPNAVFSGQIAAWLWITVLFATFAEAVAEGRGKAQAESLKRAKTDLMAVRLPADKEELEEVIPAAQLKVGDIVLVEAGELIPGDGEVIEGIASVNESAVTGESAPVILEAGGDPETVAALEVHRGLVAGETLATEVTALDGDDDDRVVVVTVGAGHTAHLRVTRA